MSVIKRKLKSDRGASITWALLIFLVCTVVGSAVLVAGTAAAGRMSKLPENDQRYYAVTSAAGLLRDALSQPFTVERSAVTESGLQKCLIQYNPADPDNADKLEKALVRKMMGWSDSGTVGYEEFTKDSIDLDAPVIINDFSISSTDNVGTALENLKCMLELGNDGSIQATVFKGDPPANSDGFLKNEYRIQMRFELNRTLTDDDGVKTDVFSWTLHDARTVLSKDKS